MVTQWCMYNTFSEQRLYSFRLPGSYDWLKMYLTFHTFPTTITTCEAKFTTNQHNSSFIWIHTVTCRVYGMSNQTVYLTSPCSWFWYCYKAFRHTKTHLSWLHPCSNPTSSCPPLECRLRRASSFLLPFGGSSLLCQSPLACGLPLVVLPSQSNCVWNHSNFSCPSPWHIARLWKQKGEVSEQ